MPGTTRKPKAAEQSDRMQVARKAAFAPRSEAVGAQLAALNEPCVGCTDCTGLCKDLIDAVVLPDLLLSRRRST